MSDAPSATLDKNKSDKTPAEIAEECLAEIEHSQSDEDYKNFVAEGTEAYKYYKNQSSNFGGDHSLGKVIFNAFWSNVEILIPIYYARLPKLIGKRRFQDAGKTGRLACKILERCTDYSLQMEQDDFNQAVKMSIKDFIIVGRGNSRSFFSAEFEDAIDSQGQPYKKVIPFTEKATTKYIYWKDYLTNKARNATDHRWRGHASYMTRAELIERFGDTGKIVPLDDGDRDKLTNDSNYKKDYVNKAKVWELWRKTDKMAYWISPSFNQQPLDAKPDPLKLEEFFPYPRPLTATTSTESDIPVGQYKIDKGLLTELKDVCWQIADIEKVIRVVGLHDRTMHDDIIKMRLLKQGQTSPANFPQGASGQLQRGIEWFPFEKAVDALEKLINYAEWLLNKLWQQDGIPDIVRGASDPNETLGAQQLKSNFTIIRTSEKQADVQRWIRDLLSNKAQIIFELFSDEMIAMMCGYESMTEEEKADYPAELALLRNDKMRTFLIDIETDSTIAVDEEEEKKNATEAFTAISNGLNVAFQTMQMDPHIGLAMLEQALYIARRFRGARDVESAFERAIDAKEKDLQAQDQHQQMIESGQIPPDPEPQDPEVMKAQHEAQMKQMKIEADTQIAQIKMGLEQQKAAQQAQLDMAIANHKAAIDQMKATSEIDLKREKLAQETLLNEKELALKASIARIEMIQEALSAAKDDQARTAEKLKAETGKGPTIPNITINLPTGKKLMRATRDPMTGDLIAHSEDIQ